MKWYKNFVVYWLVFYLFMAILGRFVTEKKEIFPFFRWSLYSKTPNTISTPYIEVSRLESNTFTLPKEANQLQELKLLAPADLNYNVKAFYNHAVTQDLKIGDDVSQYFKTLPINSSYSLYLRTIKLNTNEIDKKGTAKPVLSVNNGEIVAIGN